LIIQIRAFFFAKGSPGRVVAQIDVAAARSKEAHLRPAFQALCNKLPIRLLKNSDLFYWRRFS
jgi:DNA invertase Pin-like site-specific DNA recombinase